MITEADLSKTSMSMSFRFEPLRNIVCDLSGLIARSVRQVIDAFYPRVAGRRVEVLLNELIDNILQNIEDDGSAMFVDLEVEDGQLHVQTRNRVTPDQFEQVQQHVSNIRASAAAGELRTLMRQTIKERRRQRRTGGLGFMRLVHEAKFDIDVVYRDAFLVIDARLDMTTLADDLGDAS